MTVTALPVRDEFTGSAGQTVFNYTFLIFTNLDLNVYITPAGQDANDTTDITTAYVVDSGTIGSPIGGFITLNTGVSAGDLVTIVSNIPDNRTVDYQNSGDFLPDTVNDDFDRVVSLTKQQADRSGRTLAFPDSLQNATELTLPLPDAGLYLAWKADESGVENVGAPGVVVPGTNVGIVSGMVADTSLQVGDFVFTNGYVATGDGGDNSYEIVAALTGTDDGFTFIDLANGLQAKALFPRDVRTVRQAGVVGNGIVDDTTALQVCLDSRLRVQVPPGLYRVTNEIVWSNDSSLVGPAIYNGDRHVSEGNDYDPDFNAIIFYDGAGGADSCVLRLSKTAVGVSITDLATGNLVAPEISGLVVDANDKAEIGVYIYRTESIIYNSVAATKALKHGQLMAGNFNGLFTDMVAYFNAEMGVTLGKELYGWPAGENSINSIHIDGINVRNNGTAETYDQATNPDVGHGLWMTLGRGNLIENVNSESNDGAAFYMEGTNTSGGNTIQAVYTEGNMPTAVGEGRATVRYEAIVQANRLLTGFKLSGAYMSPSNGGRLRLLAEDLGPIQNVEQVFIIENASNFESQLPIQSSTNMYRLVNTLADTSSGDRPLFTDDSMVIAAAIFTLGDPISSIVTSSGMITDSDIVYSGSTGIANITFDTELPTASYNVSCDSTSPNKLVYAVSSSSTGLVIQLRDLAGILENGFQVSFTVRLLV